jgi:hypothetical protein
MFRIPFDHRSALLFYDSISCPDDPVKGLGWRTKRQPQRCLRLVVDRTLKICEPQETRNAERLPDAVNLATASLAMI